MIVVPHKYFSKQFRKLPRAIQEKAVAAIELFGTDPFHPTLRNHALVGKQQGLRSIDVTGDYRIIYSPISSNSALLVDIGTHSQLYT